MTKLIGDMPILGRPEMLPIPRDIIAPHEAQALANHGQTLGRLKQRGGLTPSEVVAILEGRSWPQRENDEDIGQLAKLVRAATEKLK